MRLVYEQGVQGAFQTERGRCNWYTNKVFRERSRLNLHVVCEVLRLDKQSSMVAAVSFVCTASTLWEF